MSLLPIYDPTKGMYTAVDQQDLAGKEGYADLIENYYLDRPGKLRKRDGTLAISTNLSDLSVTLIRGLVRFVDEDLAGNGEWIAIANDGSNDHVYTSPNGETWTKLVTGTGNASHFMNWVVVGSILRLMYGFDIQKWYGYIDIDDFFQNQYDPADGWVWDDRQPSYPATWEYTSLVNYDPGAARTGDGHGDLLAGFYQYKLVPVFDGVQEALFADESILLQVNNSEVDQMMMLTMGFSTTDWNNRIQSINIYRGFTRDQSPDAAYQLIDSISTRNDQARTTHTDFRTMQDRAYFPDESFGNLSFSGSGSLGSPLIGDISYFLLFTGPQAGDQILSNTSQLIILEADSLANRNITNGDWIISKWVCTSNGTWNGSTMTTHATGGNGWGGGYLWYSATADTGYSDGELLGSIIAYDTAGTTKYGMIIANIGFVVALAHGHTEPTDGSSLTVYIADVMWVVDGTDVTLYWAEYGRTDKGAHRLDGVTSITASAKYNVFWKGRIFGVNARVTKADATTEDFPSDVIYTEVGQLDIYPADFILKPETERGGIGQGIDILEEADLLLIFYRNDIEYLRVPLADPDAWRKWSNTADIGLVAPAAKVKTSVGIFFCSDDGVYLISREGTIRGPVSAPIADSYLTAVAASASSFTATYFSQQRQVHFSFGTTSEVWVLDIDTVADFPRWTKFTWGGSRLISRGAIDENGILHQFDVAGIPFYKMGDSVTGDEAFAATYRSAYMFVGTMERLNLIREMRIGHKGALAITPTALINDGADSDVKTAISAVANGENRRVNVKRYARNFSVQLVSASSTSIDHEILGIEVEVGDER